MKKIVCEMCESTEFIKKDSFFECQGCGCKFSIEEAKKMMKDVPDDTKDTNAEKRFASQRDDDDEKIPIHTPSSPNSVQVIIKKIGHPEIQITPIIHVPITVMADGPDSAGGVSVEAEIINIKGKTIKYADVYVTAINAVGDPVECSIRREATRCVRFTGPLNAGENTTGTFENAWYNHSISSAAVDHVIVEYMDGSKEKYCYATNPTNDQNQKYTLTIRRKSQYSGFTSKLKATLSNGDEVLFSVGEEKQLELPFGSYNIEFSSGLNPKCKLNLVMNDNIKVLTWFGANGLKAKIVAAFEDEEDEEESPLEDDYDGADTDDYTDEEQEARYTYALQNLPIAKGIEFNEIIELLEPIRDYKDAEGIINQCKENMYNEAMRFKSQNVYGSAMALLELIPDYKDAQEQYNECEELQPTSKKSGCYVATCVYGSYDCPQVWTLRRFRDDTLGSTWYGRLFIRAYYIVSPTLVKWFGKTNWFKKLWRGKLDRMVAKLQSNGIEDTPYEDKNW